MKWWKVVVAILVAGGGFWLYKLVTSPIPGTKVTEMGREHVSLAQAEKTIYNSNPPTSGPHYEVPSKPGIYDAPLHDGQLIHSLEHGYVIISYNCNVHLGDSKRKFFTFLPSYRLTVSAHEEPGIGTPTPTIDIPSEATGSAVNESSSCKTLIKQITELVTRKKLFKLIVVPRPGLDTTIALTAWGYIDKFDSDSIGVDAKRIEAFIDYHRDQGPEKTVE